MNNVEQLLERQIAWLFDKYTAKRMAEVLEKHGYKKQRKKRKVNG